jgi:hypothetical protein
VPISRCYSIKHHQGGSIIPVEQPERFNLTRGTKMFDSIKVWFRRRKIIKALGFPMSIMKNERIWSASETLFEELERLHKERVETLKKTIKDYKKAW